jgi:glycosyltransferase involved in cell wall biosynthesis
MDQNLKRTREKGSHPAKKPRIVILLENHVYPKDIRVQPHAEALVSQGYRVAVISPGEPGKPRYEIINGVSVYHFPLTFGGKTIFSYLQEFILATLQLFFMTLWVWVHHGMDLLLLYNPPDSLFIAAILPKLAGKKIIFDVRDLSPELYESKFGASRPFLTRLLKWQEHQSCRIADYITTVNESYKRILVERNHYPADKITLIRQGPDLNTVTLRAPDPEARARAGTLVAYLGNMSRERGTAHLLRAMHHLECDLGYTDWCCVLIGSPTPSQKLEELAQELGIRERVWFTGFLPSEKWVPILSAVDICVDPGPVNAINKISTTNKMMDYMALGKPVVCFDMPERRYTGENTVLYARENDELDLARQIACLIDNPQLRVRLGVLGRERIEKKLAWSYQRERLISLYQQVLPIA